MNKNIGFFLNSKVRSLHKIRKAAKFVASRLSRNILFWILFAFFHYYPRNSLFSYLIILGVTSVSYGLPIYFNNLILIPRFLLKRRYILYFIYLTALVMIATVETAYINKWAGSVLPPAGIKSPFGEMGIPYHSFQVILLFATLAFGKFANDAILFEENQEELKKRQLEAELEGLKAQVNPHFLFNALNTIYGLARRSDKVTADAVMQLSSILRHNLYDSSENEIEIYKEIEMLHEYISFTRLRLFDKNQITLTIKPGIRNQMIAPMVLLPFVENAFKYGFDNYAENCWVHIDIAFEDGNLIFHCSNSSRKKEKHKTNGIGLKNVKRRLELSYPGKHKLSIESKTDEFLVLLKIKLG